MWASPGCTDVVGVAGTSPLVPNKDQCGYRNRMPVDGHSGGWVGVGSLKTWMGILPLPLTPGPYKGLASLSLSFSICKLGIRTEPT